MQPTPEVAAEISRCSKAVRDYFQQLQMCHAKLIEENRVLTARVNQTSENSHRPPSSEPFIKPKSLRQKTGKKPGGQPGHLGKTLHRLPQADYVVDLHDEIFLRGCAPYKAMKPSSASSRSLKYLSEFGPDHCPEKGFHILRRTAATKLFENNIPSSVISASLGHLNPNSAEVYLSTDSKKMRKCALSLCGIRCTREELL